jgi:probable rRNA maturation factor
VAISVASRTASVSSSQASRLASPLRAIVRAALAVERRKAGEIAIMLGDDAMLRDLNHRWRGIDRSTDVLSFPYGPDRGPVEGDLVISMDRACAQAKRFRASLGKELARLVIHGTLHLAGLDHHAPAERKHMRGQERAALRFSASPIASLERVVDAFSNR